MKPSEPLAISELLEDERERFEQNLIPKESDKPKEANGSKTD